MAASAPGELATPGQLGRRALHWIEAAVPGTVALSLALQGVLNSDLGPDLDASDWWYRCSFSRPGPSRTALRLEGLATLAEVWLNGVLILQTDNMFRSYELEITDSLADTNELAICFRSLNAALAIKRPRPRWKTKLVRQQNLRWYRTTLLGRIPGWSAYPAPVGPWRPVELVALEPHRISHVKVTATLDGARGVIDFSCLMGSDGDAPVTGLAVVARNGTAVASCALDVVHASSQSARLSARLVVEDPELWWPHTHGDPSLYSFFVQINAAGVDRTLEGGLVGFRSVTVAKNDGGFEVRVNGQPLFCRGACWTPPDVISLAASEADHRHRLTLMRAAGANMIRVGGTMTYEDDAFYRVCDQLGILVWQDFMFANMDYPTDPAFLESLASEAIEVLERLAPHPCVAVYCGNSEVGQQAAMLGLPEDVWWHPFFFESLPDLAARHHPGSVYVSTTPIGGSLPFFTDHGLSHYYGVGAYRRPLFDVRRADVRFAPECLGFSNLPDESVIDAVMGGELLATGDPRWKRTVPRDSGAGWDFEDVRDHYLAEVFGVDPVQLRSVDVPRYIALSQVITGELMAYVFSEWRSSNSRCRGGLVWFLQDLRPGAGWGILDSGGEPKACYYHLQRVWQPRTVLLTDEGLNGVAIHAINETAEELTGSLELTLLRDGNVVVAHVDVPLDVPPRATVTHSAESLLGRFFDLAYAYRFGPAAFEVMRVRLTDSTGMIAESFHIPKISTLLTGQRATLAATMSRRDDSSWDLAITTDRFLYGVRLELATGLRPSDNYFNLCPDGARRILVQEDGPVARVGGSVSAVGLLDPVRITVRP